MSIVRRVHDSNFTTISNACFRDKRISARAKGIYAWVMTLPNDWQLHKQQVFSNFTEGRDALNAAWNELVDAGYVIKGTEQTRSKTGKWGCSCWTFYEKSRKNADFPLTVSPLTVSPLTVNQKLLKTIIPKTNRVITDSNESVSCDFLKRWNELAKKHGFKTCRVTPPKFASREKQFGKLMKHMGPKGWTIFWNNVTDTMIRYQGSTFIKYFTLEYVTRPDKFVGLLEDMIENFPLEKDKEAGKRAERAIEVELKELGKKQSRLDDKLDMAREGKDVATISKWVRRCKRAAKQRAELVRQLESLRGIA